jgi:hypothetical protein
MRAIRCGRRSAMRANVCRALEGIAAARRGTGKIPIEP